MGSESLESAESIQMFAATLVPLLLEVWVEACAGDRTWNSSEGAHLLTPDAMSVMFQVLTILQLLRKLPTQRENQDALVRSDRHFSFLFYFVLKSFLMIQIMTQTIVLFRMHGSVRNILEILNNTS